MAFRWLLLKSEQREEVKRLVENTSEISLWPLVNTLFSFWVAAVRGDILPLFHCVRTLSLKGALLQTVVSDGYSLSHLLVRVRGYSC